jgi:hypothetical protein
MARLSKSDYSPWKLESKSTPWELWAANIIDNHDNLTNPIRSPYIFFGSFKSKVSSDDLDVQREFLATAGDRVCMLAHLFKESVDDSCNEPAGIMLLLNARSNADAKRFIDQDPLATSGKYFTGSLLSPVNEQDVNGLHHLMARKFGEKTQLDQVPQINI